jgi:hypothetical protein
MNGTLELLKHHRSVYAIDMEAQRRRIQNRIEECSKHPSFAGFRSVDEFRLSKLRLGGAYVVNVLHTLPEVDQRIDLLVVTARNLRSNGFILIDVPSFADYYKGRMSRANAYGDGYLFRQGPDAFTFYRFSRAEEVDEWATAAGLEFDSRIVDNHHRVRIYRVASMS